MSLFKSPKRQRLYFVIIGMLMLGGATALTLEAFRDNLVFFYSPGDLKARSLPPGQPVRLGGLVESGSLKQEGEKMDFRLTDGKDTVSIHYTGLLPALFREGQGVVAEGAFDAGGRFTARRILAKHDENYMPPEVAEALKKSGHWKEAP